MGITTLVNHLIHLARLTGERERGMQFVELLATVDRLDESTETLTAIREWAFDHLDAVARHGLVAGLPVVSAAHAVVDAVDAVLERMPTAEAVLIDLTETVEVAAGTFTTDWAKEFTEAANGGSAAVNAVRDRFVAELDTLAFDAISGGDEVLFDLLCEVSLEACSLLGELAETC